MYILHNYTRSIENKCSVYIMSPGYERVYMPLYKVEDTPFYTQGNDCVLTWTMINTDEMYVTKHCP